MLLLFQTTREEKEQRMLEHTFVRPGVIARLRQSPLGPYVDAFAASLHQEGYAPYTIQRFLCAAEHIFRHTVASQMVNQGAGFKDVADVLGHQSIQTTGIYAKLELETLAAVALPWAGGAL
jgi:integrase/recombinase XerD